MAVGTSRAEQGDHVAQALQRIAHVLGEAVRAHWPDDTDPRHGPPSPITIRSKIITDSNQAGLGAGAQSFAQTFSLDCQKSLISRSPGFRAL